MVGFVIRSLARAGLLWIWFFFGGMSPGVTITSQWWLLGQTGIGSTRPTDSGEGFSLFFHFQQQWSMVCQSRGTPRSAMGNDSYTRPGWHKGSQPEGLSTPSYFIGQYFFLRYSFVQALLVNKWVVTPQLDLGWMKLVGAWQHGIGTIAGFFLRHCDVELIGMCFLVFISLHVAALSCCNASRRLFRCFVPLACSFFPLLGRFVASSQFVSCVVRTSLAFFVR